MVRFAPWAALFFAACSPGAPTRLVIPVVPISEGPLPIHAGMIEGTGIVLTGSIPLAIGDGYPGSVRYSLPADLQLVCGPLDATAAAIDEVSGSTDAITASLEGDEIVIDALDEGIARLVVRGTYEGEVPPACGALASPSSFEIRLDLRVVRPASARIDPPERCRDATVARALEGSIVPYRPVLLDGDGLPFIAANATLDAQAAVTVHAVRGTLALDLSRPVGLAAMVHPEPQTLVVEPHGGGPIEIEVVALSRVERIGLEVQLAGNAGSPLTLGNESYGEAGWGRAARLVAPVVTGMYVEGDALCSRHDDAWFELTTSTPETCSVRDFDPDEIGVVLFGEPAARAARPDVDGLCELHVRAPVLAGIPGASADVRPTLHRVDELADVW